MKGDIAALQKLDLNDLPKYTDWPSRLLNAASEKLFAKSRSSIFREYETDKWATLYANIQEDCLDLDRIESLQFGGATEIACSVAANLYLSSPLEARVELASRIAETIYRGGSNGAPIVELGAGTGAVITRIAKDPRFSGRTFVAGDFSPSAVKIIEYLARKESVEIKAGVFDFNESVSTVSVPDGSIIFASFAIAYIQGIDCNFWRRLMAFRPCVIVLAEPIYQFYREDTLLGLLRKRYYEANDYSKLILPSVVEAQEQRVLKVVSIEENSFGINPLCPVSLLTLKPFE